MDKIGSLLKQKRLEKGLTIEAVSEKTRLTIKHLKAIEEGDISYFRDDLSYLRFFLKAYCNALELDFEEIKGELQDSIDDYTTSFTKEALKEHAQIERGIAKTNEKIRNSEQPEERKQKKKKPKKARRHRKIDISLVSFLAIIVVIVIGLIFAFVMWFQGNQHIDDDVNQRPPIATKDDNTSDDNKPKDNASDNNEATVPSVPDKPEEKKEMSISKPVEEDGKAVYEIENAEIGKEIDIEVTFASDSSFRVLVNDKELSNPPARGIQARKTVLHIREKAEADKKILLAFGFMLNNSIKVNGKQLEIPASLSSKQGTGLIEFIVKGE